MYVCTLCAYNIYHLSWCPRNELKKVEELKGMLDAGFVFMEASKVCMCGGEGGKLVGVGVHVRDTMSPSLHSA